MEKIKILQILTKKAEKYNVSFCGVESNAIIETVNEALSLHNVSQHRELLIAFAKYMEEDKMYARHDEANVDDFLDNYSN